MINKATAKAIHDDLLTCVAAICEKYGLVRHKSSLTYGQMLRYRLDLSIEGGKNKDQITYERHAARLGLPALNTPFNQGQYRTAGLRIGGPHKSLLFTKKGESGKLFKMPVVMAKARFLDLTLDQMLARKT